MSDVEIKSRKLLLDIEGHLQIKFNGEKYYEEEGNCLLELGVSLHHWLIDKKNKHENYYYYSMDHDNEAIFEFQFINEDKWKIYSPWYISDLLIIVSSDVIETVVRDFISSINIDLRNRIGLTTNDFLR